MSDKKVKSVKLEKDQQKFFFCECNGEGMLVYKFAGEDELYFSYWGRGFHPKSLSLWDRLRMCYQLLFKGSTFTDEIILGKASAVRMAKYILNTLK